jgi:hypothetical protein
MRLSGAVAYGYASMGYLAQARSLIRGREVERFFILTAIRDGLNHKPYWESLKYYDN